MPWSALDNVPTLNHVLPGRFTAFTFFALLVITGYAWARKVVPRGYIAIAVTTSAALLWPSYARADIPMSTADPGYVTSGQLGRDVGTGQNVLVLPAGIFGPTLRWMSESNFSFRTPIGISGGAALPSELSDPVVKALSDRTMDYPYETDLAPYLTRVGVHTIVVPAGETQWRAIVERSLRVQGEDKGGVVLYRWP
jgi:hypothetical protein